MGDAHATEHRRLHRPSQAGQAAGLRSLVEELQHDRATGTVPERTAQSRFVRATGLSRRKLQLIERARHAARLLRAGAAIPDVVSGAGYYDQPHLTRVLRQLIGHTPAELARGGMFLDL
jgi:methylphosphotriester-DNA--protein-cysteine methyltransferase